MKKLNKSQAAIHLNVSRQTVYDLIKKGVLIPDDNGLIAFDEDDSPRIPDRCQDTFLECKDSLTGSEEKRHTITDVVIGSRRLKNQYILDLKQEIERLKLALEHRDQEFEKQDAYIRLLQAYVAFLEDTVKKYRIDLQPNLRTFFTEYLSSQHLQHCEDIMQLNRDDSIELDSELDRNRR